MEWKVANKAAGRACTGPFGSANVRFEAKAGLVVQ